MLGASVVSLPTKARGMDTCEYGRSLAALAGRSSVRRVVTEDDLPELPAVSASRYEELTGPRLRDSGHRWDDGEIAFVQHSSGSSARPKACELSAGAIRAQLAMLTLRLDFTRDDVMVSWLPLSHDMGFVAWLLCRDHGAKLALGTPNRFILSPRTWLEDCEAFGATLTVGPNFAVDMTARSVGTGRVPDLSALKTWIVGAEHTRVETAERAADALQRSGAPLDSLTPAYGLAEATLCVTMHARGEAPRVASIDVRALSEGRVMRVPANSAGSWAVVSAGRPLDGSTVRVDQAIAGSGGLGEVLVRSPSLASAYRNDPTGTSAAFVDGELRTGDQGFVEDGLLYVTGRMDGLLIVGGRSVPAESVESRISVALGRDLRSCAVVQDPQTGRLALLMEPGRGTTDEREMVRRARDALRQFEVKAHLCTVVEPGSLPRTPSGKLRRPGCRAIAFGDGPVAALR